MRPVFRGAVPTVAGVAKVVADYKDWRQDLIDTIGPYCSYCNMFLGDSPQVEHVSPKSKNPASLLLWDNMLLACGPCNRAKDNHLCPPATHYLPDTHNTHMAYEYVVMPHPKRSGNLACIPIPAPGLTNQQRVKALNTIQLCKLQSLKSGKRATDLRWKYRYDTYATALIWRNNWDRWGKADQADFLPLLNEAIANGRGFFSVWFQQFEDVAVVRQLIVNAFLNTNPSCFPVVTNYIPTALHPPDL